MSTYIPREEQEEEPHEVHEPILEYSRLDLNGTYTFWDYLNWHFKERVELIRGRIFKMSPAPDQNHQGISVNLTVLFSKCFDRKTCKIYHAPFDVRLPIPNDKKDSTVVQPDLCVICDSSKLDGHGCDGAPDLVLEILSPGNSKHEKATKFKLYEESGVKEYWVVDPEHMDVLIYTLQDGQYVGLRPFVEDMEIESPLFPNLKIDVQEIFGNI